MAKKTEQVGRETSGAFVSNDEATFEKLNQAVNSCQDLVRQVALKSSPPLIRAVVPLLVVPTGTLWQVEYSADGVLKTNPYVVERATLFLNTSWSVKTGMGETINYRLSHIEIATVDALPRIVRFYFSKAGFFRTTS